MAKPKRTSTGSWRIRFDAGYDPLTGKRLQKCETFPTQSEANRRLRQIAAAKETGAAVASDSMPLGAWLELWLREWVRVDAATLRGYRSKVRVIRRSPLGRIPLGKLRLEHLQQWYRGLERAGRAPGTIHGYAQLLGAALNQAVVLKKIPATPAAGAGLRKLLPRNQRPERPTYSMADVVRLLDVAGAPQRKEDQETWPALALMVLTGLRECEALALTWSSVHLEEGYIEVKQRQQVVDRSDNAGLSRRIRQGAKTPKSIREVVLPPQATDLLRRHLARQTKLRQKWGDAYQEHELVFCHEWGEPLGPWNLRSAFRRLQAAAGLEPIKVHDLRHTYASRSLDVGNSLEEVSKTLGHSSVHITGEVYAHVTRARKREAADRLGAALRAEAAQRRQRGLRHST